MNKYDLFMEPKYDTSCGFKNYDVFIEYCVINLQEELLNLKRHQGKTISKTINGDIYLDLIKETYEKMHNAQLKNIDYIDRLIDEFETPSGL